MPDVDIIMPVLNRVDLTYACLQSMESTDVPYRLIVIDNGSTDETPEMLQSFMLQTTRSMRVCRHEENTYVSAAWNEGIHHSDSPYVLIANNDILLPHAWLEDLIAPIAGNPEQIYCSVPLLYTQEGVWELASHSDHRATLRHAALTYSRLMGALFLLSRTCIEEVGVFDETFRIYYGDNDYWNRMRSKRAHPIALAPACPIYHLGAQTHPEVPELVAQVNEDLMHYKRKYPGRAATVCVS